MVYFLNYHVYLTTKMRFSALLNVLFKKYIFTDFACRYIKLHSHNLQHFQLNYHILLSPFLGFLHEILSLLEYLC